MPAHAAPRSLRRPAPPPPIATAADRVGIPPGRDAYRMPRSALGRHGAPSRRPVALAAGGAAAMAVTALTVKVGAVAALAHLVMAVQALGR